MKVAVMQPYFYPYLGYFELLNCVDKFILFDDANYIKKGFVHRNFIRASTGNLQINLNLKKVSQNKKINEIEIADKFENFIGRLESCYMKCDFKDDLNLIVDFHSSVADDNLAVFLGEILKFVSEKLLPNPPEFLWSSDIIVPDCNDHELRIIEKVLAVGGAEYINLPGGKQLYRQETFENHNLKLRFLLPDLVFANQENSYSILDAIAIGGFERVKKKFESMESRFEL